jgi:DNA repair protein RadA/Sms
MLLAVIERWLKLTLSDREVYSATVGGVRISEPASDLAIALAIVGAARGAAVPAAVVAIGEVGLAGELRPVSAARARLTEAARLGFTTALVPPGCGASSTQIKTIEVATMTDAVRCALPRADAR